MQIVIADDELDVVEQLHCYGELRGYRVRIERERAGTVERAATRWQDADAVVLFRDRTPITVTLLERLPGLKFIAQTGAGISHIDLAACAERGIAVSAQGFSTEATAELTWALILAARRRLFDEVQGLRSGRWQGVLGQSVRGQTLGILGYGRIGARVAASAGLFGMRVLAHGGEGSRQRAQADGFDFESSRERFFSRADVLSIHLALNAQTRASVSAADLAHMSPGSMLVNTSRAQLIQAGALVSALKAGRPGQAAIDVFDIEPAATAKDPLLALPNALCTPHLGGAERTTYEGFFGGAFAAVRAWAAGAPIDLIVS